MELRCRNEFFGGSFWPIPEISLDEKRRAGIRSEAAARNFRAILSACDPNQPVGKLTPKRIK
jgi:hypothetical protein